MAETMTIGELARQAGLSVQTLRFYEREGLLEKAARNRSGYRAYEPATTLRLQFIRRAQELGFTLAEIRELIALQGNPSSDCREVGAAAAEKLALVEGKLADLRRMQAELSRLVASCAAPGPISQCAIMNCLVAPEAGDSCVG